MINPTDCISQILENDPTRAEPLIDFVLQATKPGFKDSGKFDEVMEMLYVHTQHCREARNRYVESREAA